eukprot:m.242611 g.242611  ORF g.242611 m.242611 type:complete len:1470 (+) comp15333_c1_seq3:97-4506(+)
MDPVATAWADSGADGSSSPAPEQVVEEESTVARSGSDVGSLDKLEERDNDFDEDEDKDEQPTFPGAGTDMYSGASMFSRLFFTWVTALVKFGRKGGVELEHLLQVPEWMRPQGATDYFKPIWEAEVKAKGEKASFIKCCFRAYRGRLLIALLFGFLQIAAAIIGPIIFLQQLIEYVLSPEDNIGRGLGLAFGVMFMEIIRSTSIHMYWFLATTYGTALRSTVYAMVYEKALRLRDLSGYSVGELVNICSNDGQRLFEATIFGPFILFAAITGIVVLIGGVVILGPAAAAGCVVFFLMIPVQWLFSRASGQLRRKAIAHTDQRVRLMSEILNCIKLIKMYAWEESFAEKINDIRATEKAILQKAGYLQSTTVSLVPVLPALAVMVTFLIQAYVKGTLITVEVYPVLALFNVLRFSFAVLPMGVKAAAEATVGVSRLKRFLLLADMRLPIKQLDTPGFAVELKQATIGWVAPASKLDPMTVPSDSHLTSPTMPVEDGFSSLDLDALWPSNKQDLNDPKSAPQPTSFQLNKVDLKVKQGETIGICGSVGAGKSTLLSALLGQAFVTSGHVARSGSVAYCGQQAWIQPDSLKKNILFGKEEDETLYASCIDVCCLAQDLEMLPAGDETEIGERGINLSGGQKQRINLARAVYANRDVYLLDDPLSAVDAHVGKRIFEECIAGVLGVKTVLLVTHQLQYIPKCDRVCFVHDGYVFVDDHESLLQKNALYKEFMEFHLKQHMTEEEEVKEESESSTKATGQQLKRAPNSKSKGKLTEKEEMNRGSIDGDTYRVYAKALGGYAVTLFILFLFILAMFAKAYSDYYLSRWIKEGDGNSTTTTAQGNDTTTQGSLSNITDPGQNIADNPRMDIHATIFSCTVLALVLLQLFRSVLYTRRTLSAASSLHNLVFKRIVRAPMFFFDTTPTGRILNRFSKDMDEVDVRLPFQLDQFLQNCALIVIMLGLIAYVFPWFLLPLLPIGAFFIFFVGYFRPVQRLIKRLDNTARSPLFSQLSSSLQGIHTISAFDKYSEFQTRFFDTLDVSARAFFSFYYSNRWFALRLDYTTTAIMTVTAILVVFLKGRVDPSLAALSLTYAMSLGGLFQYTTRLSAEVEARFTSVERIHAYASATPQETGYSLSTSARRSSRLSITRHSYDDDDDHETNLVVPPPVWPADGAIEFLDVEARYRQGTPLILRGLTLEIKGREKIGVVGRTGAGKSTIAMCLYRMMELSSGQIKIDGIDISTVPSHHLRKKLSIIPQDPVLFVGTVRYNVDPFQQYSDDDIWTALENAHVRSTISALPNGLNTLVVENGENFSVGERQLLCMARALLRKSQILIMDEATAAIDTQTDSLIQETIRSAFTNCTVLTIAHRLNTILDADRILVLDEGRVAEFDSPETLLLNPDSLLSDMMASTGAAVDRQQLSRNVALRASLFSDLHSFSDSVAELNPHEPVHQPPLQTILEQEPSDITTTATTTVV